MERLKGSEGEPAGGLREPEGVSQGREEAGENAGRNIQGHLPWLGQEVRLEVEVTPCMLHVWAGHLTGQELALYKCL